MKIKVFSLGKYISVGFPKFVRDKIELKES